MKIFSCERIHFDLRSRVRLLIDLHIVWSLLFTQKLIDLNIIIYGKTKVSDGSSWFNEIESFMNAWIEWKIKNQTKEFAFCYLDIHFILSLFCFWNVSGEIHLDQRSYLWLQRLWPSRFAAHKCQRMVLDGRTTEIGPNHRSSTERLVG